MIKTLNQVGLERTYFNIIKATYDKPTVTYSLVKNRAFSLRSRSSQRCPLSPLLFNIVLEILVTAIRQEIKGIQLVRHMIFADDMILYIENPRFHQKTLRSNK